MHHHENIIFFIYFTKTPPLKKEVVAEAAGKSPLEVKHVDLRRERNWVIINKHLMRMTNVQPFSKSNLI